VVALLSIEGLVGLHPRSSTKRMILEQTTCFRDFTHNLVGDFSTGNLRVVDPDFG